jgi:hypothetical protein
VPIEKTEDSNPDNLGKGFGGFELSSAHVLSCIYLIARDQQGLLFSPQQEMKAEQRLKNKDELG